MSRCERDEEERRTRQRAKVPFGLLLAGFHPVGVDSIDEVVCDRRKARLEGRVRAFDEGREASSFGSADEGAGEDGSDMGVNSVEEFVVCHLLLEVLQLLKL